MFATTFAIIIKGKKGCVIYKLIEICAEFNFFSLNTCLKSVFLRFYVQNAGIFFENLFAQMNLMVEEYLEPEGAAVECD